MVLCVGWSGPLSWTKAEATLNIRRPQALLGHQLTAPLVALTTVVEAVTSLAMPVTSRNAALRMDVVRIRAVCEAVAFVGEFRLIALFPVRLWLVIIKYMKTMKRIYRTHKG